MHDNSLVLRAWSNAQVDSYTRGCVASVCSMKTSLESALYAPSALLAPILWVGETDSRMRKMGNSYN